MRFAELGRLQSIIPEGIRNWNGLLCASIARMLPMEVRDVFVQEAAVAEEELEQEVRSFVFCTLTGLHRCPVVGQKSQLLPS